MPDVALEVMMDDLISALHDIASRLLEHAEAIDGQLGEAAPDQHVIRDSLESLCKALSDAVALLEAAGSPLDTLVKTIAKSPASLPMATLAEYLRDHRSALEKMGIASKTIDKIVAALEAPARYGDAALDSPQTLEHEHALAPLRELRDWICEMAKVANVADLLTEPAMLKLAAKGVMGAAIVVVDITGAATAAPVDPVGWVLFKAVKSVWAGAGMVRSAIAEGRAAWGRVKDVIARRTQAQVDENHRKLKSGSSDKFRFGGQAKDKPPQG